MKNLIYSYLDEPLKGLSSALKCLMDYVTKKEDELLDMMEHWTIVLRDLLVDDS